MLRLYTGVTTWWNGTFCIIGHSGINIGSGSAPQSACSGCCRLKLSHKGDEILLLWFDKLEVKHQVEELYGIL